MKHEYKVGDRVAIVKGIADLVPGDIAKIIETHKNGAIVEKNGRRHSLMFARFIPFREVPPTFPALPEGVQIGDEVDFYDSPENPEGARFSNNPWLGELKATTSDGRFVDAGNTVWDHCRAIPKTITRFKSFGFLISDLERRGYKRKGPDFSIGEHGCGYSVAYLLEKAGTRYHNEPNTPANWLEEVPECKS